MYVHEKSLSLKATLRERSITIPSLFLAHTTRRFYLLSNDAASERVLIVMGSMRLGPGYLRFSGIIFISQAHFLGCHCREGR